LRLRVFASKKSISRKDAKTQSLKKAIGLDIKKQNSGNPSIFCEQTGVLPKVYNGSGYKNKTPVISRSFNHQSKNEQLIRLLLLLCAEGRKFKVSNVITFSLLLSTFRLS
jgi:hypothetical protein